MNKLTVLAADPSRRAALPSPVLASHPSRMLASVLDGALRAGRLGRDHRSTCSFADPKRAVASGTAPRRRITIEGSQDDVGLLGRIQGRHAFVMRAK